MPRSGLLSHNAFAIIPVAVMRLHAFSCRLLTPPLGLLLVDRSGSHAQAGACLERLHGQPGPPKLTGPQVSAAALAARRWQAVGRSGGVSPTGCSLARSLACLPALPQPLAICLLSSPGCRYYADLVIAWIQQVVEDVRLHPLEAADEQEAQEELPPPMYKVQCRELHCAVCGGGLVAHGQLVCSSRKPGQE